MKSQTSSLELAVIGNSRIGALIDTRASVVWMCVPRFDGDPVFCALLDDDSDQGRFDIELQDCVSITQAYERNTAIVRTEMADSRGARLEIVDFAPRFHQHGRMFAPVSIVRIVHRLAGRPRIRVRFAPRCEYGAAMPAMTFGSHHIRADVPAYPLRLTTDAPITHVIESRSLLVEGTLTFILGPDETLAASPHETGRHMYEETAHYWRRWVRNLAVPFEWQEEVIRAAITLKLNTFDDTGGIVAALTTSVPEAPHTQRTWDYRYCWLRDAYFVINALNRLGATDSLERYLHYIENIVADAQDGSLQPVYALNGTAELGETTAAALSGYRRHGASARRQPCLHSGSKRCLRLGDPWRSARVLRLPARARRRRRVVSSARSSGRAGVCPPRACRRQPLGISRPPGGSYLFSIDVLGGLRQARANCEAIEARRTSRVLGAACADHPCPDLRGRVE